MKKLIIIRGPSGVGKTTISRRVVEMIKEKIPRFAYIQADRTIREFLQSIQYQKDRNNLGTLQQKNTESLVSNFLKENYTVLLDGMFHRKVEDKTSLDRLIKIAKTH
ncbi:MAG: tRNA uridine 5-carbamoylmethylation protein Kti12 [Patescibacteria group bacterium]|jgi:tRNA uridine 5-carbamoylmethylation protein Kti12